LIKTRIPGSWTNGEQETIHKVWKEGRKTVLWHYVTIVIRGVLEIQYLARSLRARRGQRGNISAGKAGKTDEKVLECIYHDSCLGYTYWMNCNNKRLFAIVGSHYRYFRREMEKERSVWGNEISSDWERNKKTVHGHKERKISTTGKHKGKYTKASTRR